jgi:hypothetical protein
MALLLACSAGLLAQSEKEKEKKSERNPPARHQQSAPQRHEQTAPPQREQSAPPQREQSAPPQRHEQSAPQQHQQAAPPQREQQAAPPQHQPAAQPDNQRPRPAEQRQPPANTGAPSQGRPFGNDRPPAARPDGQPSQTQPGQGQRFGQRPENGDNGRRFGRDAAPGGGPVRPAYTPRPNMQVQHGAYGRDIVHAPNGSAVHMAGGRVVEVHAANGAIIRHTPDGIRRVEVVRPGGRTVVVNGGGGYVQKTVVISNRSYVQRTYVVHNVVVTRVYTPYTIRPGFAVNVYTPVRYYRPGFYVYAYNPWPRPVYYSAWGWAGSPWYGFYGGYFAPAPYYASPAFWLTDYMVAAMLQQAYQDRMAAQMPPPAYAGGQTPLSPEVKQEIADEVNRQLRQEQAAAQAGGTMASADPFAGGPHVFVASSGIDAGMGNQACSITEGDVLAMQAPPPPGSPVANVLVRASKRGDCPVGSMVSVQLQDLAEMQNRMREEIDRGLADMQTRQGQSGMPAMTGEVAAPAAPVSWASQVQADATAQAELAQVSQEANRAEQDAVSATLEQNDSAQPGGKIGLGSTVDEVIAAFGQPQRTADLGSKKIYIYKDVKVTFQDGKVVDVQ